MKKAALLFIITLLTVCLSSCGKQPQEPFVVKIGQDNVYSPEFRFYFLLSQMAYEGEGGEDIWLTTINGVKAEDVAKDRTLESIARVKISCMQADGLGIELAEEDKDEASEMADFSLQTMSENLDKIGITREQLQIIMEETLIYGKVFNEITKNVQISEKDFNSYYDNYIDEQQYEITTDDDAFALREDLRRLYAERIKNEIFAGEYSKWEAGVSIEKNPEAWDAIHILRY